jgi:chromosome segregation ATPase
MKRLWNYLAPSFLGLSLLHMPIQCLHGEDWPPRDETAAEQDANGIDEDNSISLSADLAASWSLARRQTDPIGFAEHVEEAVRSQLREMRRVQTLLRTELAQLNEKHRELQGRQTAARLAAKELRDLHHDGIYPVAFNGDDLADSAAVTARVSLLLAEDEGYSTTLRKLQMQIRAAQQQSEILAVRISDLDAQVIAVRGQRARLVVSRLPSDADQLLAQLSKLLPRLCREPTEHELRVTTYMAEQSTKELPAKLKGRQSASTKPLFQQF